MKPSITPCAVPAASIVSGQLAGAYYADCYRMAIPSGDDSALQLYLNVVARTPAWINAMMKLRNRVVARLGLKDLGLQGEIDAGKPAAAYRVGDRVGIFTLLHVSENEVVLGDSDKHLRAQVSVCKLVEGVHCAIAVSTVVHIHNLLGRVYMLFVTPMHKLIVPASLRRLAPG